MSDENEDKIEVATAEINIERLEHEVEELVEPQGEDSE